MPSAWSIAGRQNLRTISMVSSDVRNSQMSKANPYDPFQAGNGFYIRMDPIGVTAGRTGSSAPNILWTESSILAQDERWRRA